ncbi:MAG: hypothetical protein IJP29_02785 [Lachnospiraceae bacterium]|nr:hypothetical protein [Lachnospiraceae bacterium]
MFIIALIIGILFGVGLAYWIVGTLVDRSNNHGDSKGTFNHFSTQPIHMLASENNIRKSRI